MDLQCQDYVAIFKGSPFVVPGFDFQKVYSEGECYKPA